MDYLLNQAKLASRAASVGGLGAAIPDIQSVNEARKPAAMEVAIKELEGQHARLDALVGELERRLQPVLLPTAPSPEAGEAHGPASMLSGKLFEEGSIVRRLAERIDSIISRVDL